MAGTVSNKHQKAIKARKGLVLYDSEILWTHLSFVVVSSPFLINSTRPIAGAALGSPQAQGLSQGGRSGHFPVKEDFFQTPGGQPAPELISFSVTATAISTAGFPGFASPPPLGILCPKDFFLWAKDFTFSFGQRTFALPFPVGQPGVFHRRTASQKQPRAPLHLTLPPGTHLAGGSARGGDATVEPAPAAARRAAQMARFRDTAGKCRAGAAGAEPGTAFAWAEAEAGAFGGRDRGNPETPGPHQLAAAKAAGPGSSARQGSRGPGGAPGGAEPPSRVSAAGAAAREVSAARRWGTAGAGQWVAAAHGRGARGCGGLGGWGARGVGGRSSSGRRRRKRCAGGG